MIPGIIITILTFPGVIVHELAHMLMCRILKVAVFDVCFFRLGRPSGYVIHEPPKENYKNLLIGIGPFFFNTIIGALIASPSILAVIKFDSGNVIDYFLVWLGISIAMHSFPSTGDAKSIWQSMSKKGTNIFLKLISAPIVLIIYLFAFGSIFWLDLVYGVVVSMILPNLLIWILS